MAQPFPMLILFSKLLHQHATRLLGFEGKDLESFLGCSRLKKLNFYMLVSILILMFIGLISTSFNVSFV